MTQRRTPVQLFLARLDRALREDRVLVLEDARSYAIRDFGWEIEDIFAFLYVLDAQDFSEHVPSTAPEGGNHLDLLADVRLRPYLGAAL